MAISIQPYYKPKEDLIEVNSTTKKLKRVREPIMFSIEPMPSKVNFKLTMDANKDQALLGDIYEVIVDIETEEIQI